MLVRNVSDDHVQIMDHIQIMEADSLRSFTWKKQSRTKNPTTCADPRQQYLGADSKI